MVRPLRFWPVSPPAWPSWGSVMLTLTSPVKTWAHGLPAAVKLTALCGATIGLFALNSPLPLATAALAAVLLMLSGGAIFAKTALRHLRPLWPFVLIVALWHLWSRDLSGGAVVIRFIPVMQDRAEQISQSWRARSARRAGWRVLMPATLAALDDAEHVAEALRARGGSA